MNFFFSDPENNIKKAGILDGTTIADFGCGTGAYTLAVAKLFSKSVVYAIDVQKPLLERVETEAKHNHLNNIRTVWADIEKNNGTRLRHESVDWVIVSNTLFLSPHKDVILKEAFRVLHKKGNILVVEWSGSFGGMGPMPEQVVTENEAKTLLQQTGFEIASVIDAGAHHYGIIGIKK